jgi:3-oxosteroid 1-dehydrogenase
MSKEEFDVVVVGSGAGAFMAALRAATLGAKKIVMLEKGDEFGGTSAKSGGGIWIPNSKNIAQAGVQDSEEDAFSYMRAVIPTEQVSDDTIRTYIQNAPKMVDFLESTTELTYTPVTGYADYYPEVKGWKEGGRTMDPSPVDGRKLGDKVYSLVEAPMASKAMGRFSMSILEGMQILAKTPGWEKIFMGIIWKYITDIPGRFKDKRDRRLAQGNALIGAMYLAAKDKGIELRMETAVDELIQENGRVVGVKATSKNGQTEYRATKGVVVAAGGFEQNPDMRKEYLPQPTCSSWSSGVKTNTGDLIRAGQAIGAETGLMNEAWWAPVVKTPHGPTVLFSEKSKPGLIIVDKAGKRFMNEAITYNSYGECFYNASAAGSDCVPATMIFDATYREKYIFGGMPQSSMSPDFMNKAMVGENGTLTKVASISELAQKFGIDENGLKDTFAKMATYAKSGVDEEFGKGSDAHDCMYGDVEVTPNPCLGDMSKGPYYVAKIYPGDIGTKGGLVINNDAQVLNKDGQPIEGLFAAGNCTASIMGNKYPGAGCTLGPAMTMAYLAANKLMA